MKAFYTSEDGIHITVSVDEGEVFRGEAGPGVWVVTGEDAESLGLSIDPYIPTVIHATSCTPAQGQLALYQTGHYDAFNDAVAASPYVPLKIYASAATKWEIINPYIQAMQAELGLSDDQVQALFDLAVTL